MLLARNIFAIVIGVLAGAAVTLLVESVNMLLYPLPTGMDMNNKDELAKYIHGLPLTAFLIVVVAFALGSFSSTWVTRRMTPNRASWPALITGLLYLLATVNNFFQIPHPLWMLIASLAVVLIGFVLGMTLSGPSEYNFVSNRQIRSTVSRVFDTISKIDEFSKAIPGIDKIEILSGGPNGVGTRFRETRTIDGRQASSILEVSELVANDRIRLDSEMMNTRWSTLFTVVQSEGGNVNLSMQTRAIPHGVIAKLMLPMMLAMVRKCLDADLDAVKRHSERG